MGIVGGSEQREGSPEERLSAVRRHAQRAAQDLEFERTDSVLDLARAFGAIDRDEVVAQFEARVGFLERQVERLAGRREQVDRAVHGELQLMRARVAEALRAVEEATEADRRARQALEARVRAMIDTADERSAKAGEALRENLVASWRGTVESRERVRMEALESELAQRANAARELVAEIRRDLEAQVAATARAAMVLADTALGGVLDRLPPPREPAGTPVPAPREPGGAGGEAGR